MCSHSQSGGNNMRQFETKKKKTYVHVMRVMYKKTTIRYINIKESKNTWVKATGGELCRRIPLDSRSLVRIQNARRSTNKNTDCADVSDASRVFPSLAASARPDPQFTIFSNHVKSLMSVFFSPLFPLSWHHPS